MKTNTLMVQGTTSDAGKSILVAGICRVLARRGVSVAPFKPQNMALNSAVTRDGGEIGRAQALQAQACGIEAHTDMNPILLKPCSDTGAQVIVQGQALTNMEAESFHDYKAVAMSAVLDSFERLTQQYDVVIVEGAGSPAEINLRENDIANMGFAEAVDCPVIIIADIDRGGVFAHLVGTLELLSPSEQQRVTGFVINRFRGEMRLLESGLDWLEEKTQRPVWGVIPFLTNFYLDAEDALHPQHQPEKESASFTIAVPVFSRISNHTDFDTLQLHPDIHLQLVGPKQRIPNADLIILPGTKNVRKDLALLKDYGWDVSIQQHLRYGGKVLGICGGYQMLGELIQDPQGIEDVYGESVGLGVLPLTTVLAPEKQLKNVQGVLALNQSADDVSAIVSKGVLIKGYEIHCGVTSGEEVCQPFALVNEQGTYRREGVVSDDGLVAGTYLHGLFDMPQAAAAILSWAGMHSESCHAVPDVNRIREEQLERLADCLEETLNPVLFEQLIKH